MAFNFAHPADPLLKDNIAVISFLEKARVFQGVDRSFIETFVVKSHIRSYPKGSILLQEGQPNNNLIMLLKGGVSIYSKGHYIYTLRRSGDLVGEMSLIKETVCSASVYTDSDPTEILVTPNPKQSLKETPEVLYQIYTMILVDKLRKTTEKARMYEENLDELKQMNRELQHAKAEVEMANKAKNNFLAIVSHEIRTPLNVVIGLINLLGETPLNDDQKNMIQKCEKSGNRLVVLIDNILEISSMETGVMEADMISFDLLETMEKFVRVMSADLIKPEVELVVDINPDVPIDLIGDPLRVDQILINILDNAYKFTEEGSILIKIEAAPDSMFPERVDLFITVRDTGVGIAQEKLKNVFESFTQGDDATNRKYSGTGLGLSLSKKLVQQIRGNIMIDSQENQGTTVKVFLPLKQPVGQRKYYNSYPLDLKGKSVLVMENLELTRNSLIAILRQWKADVTIADSYHHFQSLLQHRPIGYDLAMVDYLELQKLQLFKEEAMNKLEQHCGNIVLLVPQDLNPNESDIPSRHFHLQKPVFKHKLQELLSKWHKSPHAEQQPV